MQLLDRLLYRARAIQPSQDIVFTDIHGEQRKMHHIQFLMHYLECDTNFYDDIPELEGMGAPCDELSEFLIPDSEFPAVITQLEEIRSKYGGTLMDGFGIIEDLKNRLKGGEPYAIP